MNNHRSWWADYFFLMRPILFFPGWATFVAGFLLANNAHHNFPSSIQRDWKLVENTELLLGLLSFTLAMGGCFILNQLQDIHSDNQNKKLFLLGEGFVPPQHGYWQAFILILLSLILAWPIHLFFWFAIGLFIFITGYLYNFPPFAFKNTPWRGLLSNLLMGWLALAGGWFINNPFNLNFLKLSVPYICYNTALYLLTTLPDIKGDAETHKHTIAVKYGSRFTIYFSIFLYILSFLTGLWQHDRLILIVLLLVSPFWAWLLFTRNLKSAVKTLKYSILVFALVISSLWPMLLLLMLIVYIFTRMYYAKRFHLHYPNLKAE